MSDQTKLNGSVNMLADAMRRVFTESVEGAVEPLREDMCDMEKHLVARADTTDRNVQVQIADMERRPKQG